MKFKKLLSVISVVLCVVLLINTSALAVKSQPESAVKSISIFPMYGVVEGEIRQMQAAVDAGDSFLSAVEWSSSNPEAISCTEDGKIKGLVAGESAIITCKAKWGSVNDKIKVYCVKKISPAVKCKLNGIFIYTLAQPAQGKWSRVIWNIPSFLDMLLNILKLVANASVSSMAFPYPTTDSKVTVYGRVKEYAYVRFGESNMFDGFINYKFLPENTNAFLNLSTKNMNVWANGITYEGRNLTTSYKGTVDWTVENNKYISFDEETGQITGKTEGIGKKVKITAKADGMTESCTIHLLYKWKQPWTTKTNKETYLYNADENTYVKGNFLAKGKEFVVQGDCGTSSGWAYGYCKINGENRWGYVPIADVSTKGTVSQYNNLGWSWPVKTPAGKNKANYISSPYGWRDTSPKRHQGIDITTGKSGEIQGYEVVSAFDGTVDFICDKEGYDWGYCVAIRSNKKDSVSGKQYIAVYMHLENPPKLIPDQPIAKGAKIGTVGNTTVPDVNMGYHLHFEFNNQNSSISLSNGKQISGYGRKSYDYLVNPIFLYIDEYEREEIFYNEDSEAENYMKTFWYGNGDSLNEAS